MRTMDSAPIDDLLTTVEVMAFAGRSRKTVQRWVKDGDLKPVKQLTGPYGAYLFSRSDVAAVLARKGANDDEAVA